MIKAHKAILYNRCPFIKFQSDEESVDMKQSNSLTFNLILKYFYTYDISHFNEYKDDYITLTNVYFDIIETKKDYIELFNPIIEKIMELLSPDKMHVDTLDIWVLHLVKINIKSWYNLTYYMFL